MSEEHLFQRIIGLSLINDGIPMKKIVALAFAVVLASASYALALGFGCGAAGREEQAQAAQLLGPEPAVAWAEAAQALDLVRPAAPSGGSGLHLFHFQSARRPPI